MCELELRGVTKKYGDLVALNDFSYLFTPGIYAILGANGSGKTTMFNLITDNLAPTCGEIRFDGMDIKSIKKIFRAVLGYMPQQQRIYDDLSLIRFMYYIAALKGIKRPEARRQIDMLLERVHLTDVRNMKMKKLSGGMRQRALLAQAMLGAPQILVLDEPTAGVDPGERIAIRNLIFELSAGRIVLIATHIVSDIELIAEKVLILKKGKLVQAGPPDELCKGIEGRVREIILPRGADTSALNGKISSMVPDGEKVTIRVIDSDTEEGKPVFPSLEELFLDIFGNT